MHQQILLIIDGSSQNGFIQQGIRQGWYRTRSYQLDGTAKGGVVIGISDQFQIPIKFIGVGEKIEDLKLFDKKEFVESLFK